MDSITVLNKELAEARTRVDALTSAIAALGGKSSGGKKRHVSAATRKKIAAAQKKRWAKEKGKKAE